MKLPLAGQQDERRHPLPSRLTDKAGGAVGKGLRKLPGTRKTVPGLSTNPATNLLIADIGVRAIATLTRRAVEKGLLRANFDREQAHDIVEGRGTGINLASYVVARTATRSLPGFLVVSAGLAAKILLDRGLRRGKAEAEGMKTLDRMAEGNRD